MAASPQVAGSQTTLLRAGATKDIPDRSELLQRAEALRPLLRAHAAEGEHTGRVAQQVIDALCDAELFRAVQPVWFGGFGLSPTVAIEITDVLGHECMSTAWVYANLAIHNGMIVAWPLEAQAEVWGKTPDAVISAAVAPSGRAMPAPGGFILSGRWSYASGIYHCPWVIVGGLVQKESGPEACFFLLHRDQYAVLDTWHVSGLRGTGSTDIEVKEQFVPAQRVVIAAETLTGTAPGFASCPQPYAPFPYEYAGTYFLVAAQHGAARGALEVLVRLTKARIARNATMSSAADLPATQGKIAEAVCYLDAAQALIRKNLQITADFLSKREVPSGFVALQIKRDASFCSKLCVKAVNLIYEAAGASALYEANAIERFWRDVHAGAAHAYLRWDVLGPAYGRVELGLPSGLPGMAV